VYETLVKTKPSHTSPAKCKGRPLRSEKVSKKSVTNAWTSLAALLKKYSQLGSSIQSHLIKLTNFSVDPTCL